MTQGSSRKLGAAFIVIGAALLFAGARSRPILAGPYAFASVIQVTKADSETVSLGEALREECDLLESSALLEGVVSNLNLTAKWSTTNDQVSVSDARHRLSANLLVMPDENAGQIRLRVSGPDKQQTEEIANSILRVYPEVRRSRFRQSKPKIIVTLEEQLEEVEPRLQLALDTMERVGTNLNFADLYEPSRADRTLLDRIREGKEDDQPDNTSSYYAYDPPPPKDETPEQAKRRIYLKNRRAAEVLSLRKQRIEARLDIERSRTSTPQSATVQVVQQPQPAEAVIAAPTRRNKGWYFGGAACLLLGFVSLTRKPAPAPGTTET